MLDFLNCLKESIVSAIKKHKVYFFVFLSCILISLIIASIASINYFNYFSIKNLTDKTLISYLNKDISLLSFFFKRIFQYLCILLIIYLLSLNKYSSYLNILLCCFIAFNIVFNFVILIALFGFFGLIHSLLITLICGLVFLTLIFFFSLLFYSYTTECACTKNYFLNYKCYLYLLLVAFIVVLIITIYEIIFIPFTTSTFIVVF